MLRHMRKLTQQAEGHLWTILPALQDTAQPAIPPPQEPWELTTEQSGDPATLRGAYTHHEHARGLVIIVPGLGATPKSSYCLRCATTLLRAGYSSLRLGTTLCPTQPPDFHRRQLVHELRAALAAEPLSRYESVYLLGYSMGGHAILRAAADGLPAAVRAIAVVSTPLDLSLSQVHIDAPSQLIYRRYLLSLLQSMYVTEAGHGRLPEPPAKLASADSLRDYDAILNAIRPDPAKSVDSYYREASARWVLPRIEQPVLAVISPTDPMIPARAVRESLVGQQHSLEVHWPVGGHIYFPDDTDLGQPGPKGLVRQIVAWWKQIEPSRQAQGKSSIKPTLCTS